MKLFKTIGYQPCDAEASLHCTPRVFRWLAFTKRKTTQDKAGYYEV